MAKSEAHSMQTVLRTVRRKVIVLLPVISWLRSPQFPFLLFHVFRRAKAGRTSNHKVYKHNFETIPMVRQEIAWARVETQQPLNRVSVFAFAPLPGAHSGPASEGVSESAGVYIAERERDPLGVQRGVRQKMSCLGKTHGFDFVAECRHCRSQPSTKVRRWMPSRAVGVLQLPFQGVTPALGRGTS